MKVLLVATALLVSASAAQAYRLPCSTNPGPNCYNDVRPTNKLAGCEHLKDEGKLRCYKLTGPGRQGCIDIENMEYTACVNNAIH